MPTRPSRAPGSDGAIAAFLLALLFLLSPMVQLWAGPRAPWWLVFALWGGLIALTALVQRRPRA